MTVLEIVLLIIGIIAVIASFLIPEKKTGVSRSLKPEDYEEMKRAFRQEMMRMMEEEKEPLSASVAEEAKEMIQDYMEEARQGISRISHDHEQQVQAMQDTADNIAARMNERYNEVSTLYAMLNDKHTQVDGDMQRLEQIRSEILMIQGKLEMLQEETRQAREEYEEKVKDQMLQAIGQSSETVESEDSGLPEDALETETPEEEANGGTRVFDTGKVAQAVTRAEQEKPDLPEEKIAQLFQPIEAGTEDAAGSAEAPHEPEAEAELEEAGTQEAEAATEEPGAPEAEAEPEEAGTQEAEAAMEEVGAQEEAAEADDVPVKVPEKLLEALRESNTIETEIEESVCKKVLQLYEAGFGSGEISQSLKIGIGQVRMIVDLYTGREIDH